jgi:hypothetical protein
VEPNRTKPKRQGPSPPSLNLELRVDGAFLITWDVGDNNGPGLSTTEAFGFVEESAILFEPGAADARTLTATISDDCADEDFTVTSVKVNVIGFS